ncbi:hypothetical protein NLJ89_g7426 [Agrocybe chaxingu]|uniref:Uncharacterized protein n=1 Tax=Agrocybe chaxingu TaxID=84603 RepID=A0A9W8JXE0_9AGAR|nr:hypothetical protein NLJ89_g7426 [Agrocybe chaxingu]
MSHPASPKSLETLNNFSFERILHEDPITHSLTLLGTFPNQNDVSAKVQAIVRIEKTALSAEDSPRFFGENGLIRNVEVEESTDIYTWLFGWLKEERERDVKINVICPATEVHIRKYTTQERIIVHETPGLYEKHVKPYIDAFPPSRTKWVENILTGVSEQHKVLFSNPEFLILPDMKWDLKTVSSLYLVALVQDRTIRSLHHFHVHIVNVNYEGGLLGMAVGQAHLLDDVISMLEQDTGDGPGIFQRMTLTYTLGDQHGLYEALRESLEDLAGQ